MFKPVTLPVYEWDSDAQIYKKETKKIQAHTVVHPDFSIFLHGPKLLPSEQQPEDSLPPLYVSGTIVDKIWRIDGFRAVKDSFYASMKLVAWAIAPSTMYPITKKGDPTKKMHGFLSAQGNPFWVNPGNHTWNANLGGVSFMDGKTETCQWLFPSPDSMMKAMGYVVNTVDCHEETEVCFFSVWKFYDDSMPMMTKDCVWWCKVDDIHHPTKCLSMGILEDENGKGVCHKDGKGAVHGLTITKTDPSNPLNFEMLLIFTGKGTFDRGDSSIWKTRINVFGEGKDTKVHTLGTDAWGTDLTKKSVQSPHDVGVDHAWLDETGKTVYLTTFRKMNDGIHQMDYESGTLIRTIRGIDNVIPDAKFNYASGIDGIGQLGKKGSYLAVATCEQWGMQFLGGKSAVVLVDLGKGVFENEPHQAEAEMFV